MTQPKTLRNVAYNGVALISGGSVKIGSLGQKRVGANNMTPEQQKAALLSIRQMFREGFGYRASDHKWEQLVDAVAPTEKPKFKR